MRQRYRTKKRENSIIIRIVMLVALLGTGLALLRGRNLLAQKEANTRRIAELQTQIESEEARTRDIEEFEKETHTRRYIEKIAREKLGLVYPGEIIFEKASE
jgi:cell division protein FtsB